MACGTKTVYSGKQNKGLSSTLQLPEEGWSIQRPKRCDKHGDKDDNNSLKNVNNEHYPSSQKYRQILKHTHTHTHTYCFFLSPELLKSHHRALAATHVRLSQVGRCTPFRI